jgi:hypothetical protein
VRYKSHLMFVLILAIISVETICSAETQLPAKSAFISQGEFAKRLIKALQLGAGLPAVPVDDDFKAVLGGNRVFRFEAEDYFNSKKDSVSVRSYPLYGPFSGKGWISGIATTTAVHFKLMLPREGEYTVAVASKGDGQKWSISGKEFTVNAGENLRLLEAGSLNLPAGEHEISVQLPPEGAIDYLLFTAPSLRPIEPTAGWHFNEPIRKLDIADMIIDLLDLTKSYARDSKVPPLVIAAAGTSPVPPSLTSESGQIFGKFFSGKWLRSSTIAATLEIPIVIEQEGVFGVKMNYLGERYTAVLDGFEISGTAKPYFTFIDLGVFRLAKGKHTLRVNLLPYHGIDLVQVDRLQATPTDTMKIAGLTGDPASYLTPAEADAIISSITARYKKGQ